MDKKYSTKMNFFTSKKIKKSDRDPFNPEVFPEEIQSAILNFLPLQDFLNATLVSKSWNIMICCSPEFKRVVGIKLHPWSDEPTMIESSERCYEILSIADFKLQSRKLNYLRSHKWRHVTLSVGSIGSQNKFVNVMKIFQNSIKDLKILSTNIAKLNGNPTIELPELENLILSDVTLDLFDVLMVKQPSIRSLSMRHVITDVKSPRSVGDALIQFLNLNDSLKDLEMNYIVTNDLFKANVAPAIATKLKNVIIGLNETKSEVRENIEKFLQSQGGSIERLKLILHQKFIRQETHQWRYWDEPEIANDSDSEDINIIYRTWNSMAVLSSITIRFLRNSSELPDSLEIRDFMKTLKRNVNVTSLNLQFMNVDAPPSVIINLMKLAPNLQSIYVTKLSSAVVLYAAVNLKALRCLRCFAFSDDCLQEYTQLKGSRDNVNKFIVISDRCALG